MCPRFLQRLALGLACPPPTLDSVHNKDMLHTERGGWLRLRPRWPLTDERHPRAVHRCHSITKFACCRMAPGLPSTGTYPRGSMPTVLDTLGVRTPAANADVGSSHSITGWECMTHSPNWSCLWCSKVYLGLKKKRIHPSLVELTAAALAGQQPGEDAADLQERSKHAQGPAMAGLAEGKPSAAHDAQAAMA